MPPTTRRQVLPTAKNRKDAAARPPAPKSKFWAVDSSHLLKGPAIFTNWADCQKHLLSHRSTDDSETSADNPQQCHYRDFDALSDACQYVLWLLQLKKHLEESSGGGNRKRGREDADDKPESSSVADHAEDPPPAAKKPRVVSVQQPTAQPAPVNGNSNLETGNNTPASEKKGNGTDPPTAAKKSQASAQEPDNVINPTGTKDNDGGLITKFTTHTSQKKAPDSPDKGKPPGGTKDGGQTTCTATRNHKTPEKEAPAPPDVEMDVSAQCAVNRTPREAVMSPSKKQQQKKDKPAAATLASSANSEVAMAAAQAAAGGREIITATVEKQAGAKLGLTLSEVEDKLVVTNVKEGGPMAGTELGPGMEAFSINSIRLTGKTSAEAAGILVNAKGTITIIAFKDEMASKSNTLKATTAPPPPPLAPTAAGQPPVYPPYYYPYPPSTGYYGYSWSHHSHPPPPPPPPPPVHHPHATNTPPTPRRAQTTNGNPQGTPKRTQALLDAVVRQTATVAAATTTNIPQDINAINAPALAIVLPAATSTATTTTATTTATLLPRPVAIPVQVGGKTIQAQIVGDATTKGAQQFTEQLYGHLQGKTNTQAEDPKEGSPNKDKSTMFIRKLKPGSVAWQRWETRFQHLQQYKEKYNSLKISKQHPEGQNRTLSDFVFNQRNLLQKEAEKPGSTMLTSDHIQRLKDLGVTPRSTLKTQYGHHACAWVPDKYLKQVEQGEDEDPATSTTNASADGTDDAAADSQSVDDGDDGAPTTTTPTTTAEASNTPAGEFWEDRFQQLLRYKEKYETTDIIDKHKANDDAFCRWVDHERKRMRKVEQLQTDNQAVTPKDAYIVEKLQGIGFQSKQQAKSKKEWSANKIAVWEAKFQMLKDYKEQHGTLKVAVRKEENWTRQLRRWAGEQATAIRDYQKDPTSSNMTPERIDRLLELGVESATYANLENCVVGASWEEMFQLLLDFKQANGHVEVPDKNPQNYANWSKKLRNWTLKLREDFVRLQQGQPAAGYLTPDRITQLRDLGFRFQTIQRQSFDYRAAEWLEYYSKHGQDPPKDSGTALATWVRKTKTKYWHVQQGMQAAITQEQIDKLKSWGFDFGSESHLRGPRHGEKRRDFDYRAAEWHEYYTQHGHDPPKDSGTALATWVSKTRTKYRKFQQGMDVSITQEQIDRLKSWGFDFGSETLLRIRRESKEK